MSNTLFTKADSAIECDLCFRHCTIDRNSTGFCGVNANVEGVLTSLVYGKPSAVHIDPIEKKPLYHYYPGSSIYSIGTVGCNFHCPFCQNWHLAFQSPSSTPPYTVAEVIEEIHNSGCTSVAFTYNEPTVAWLWYRDLAEAAKSESISTVMVTNGAMSRSVCKEMSSRIDAVNIDVKSFDQNGYAKLGGSYSAVVDNVKELREAGIWIELTTLIVPTISDSIAELDRSADCLAEIAGVQTPWHISAYHPAYHFSKPALPNNQITHRCELLRSKGFAFVYEGNTNTDAITRCPQCNTALIERSCNSVTLHLDRGTCPACGKVLEGRFL